MHTIRPATIDDAATILEIQLMAFAEEGRLIANPDIPPLTESIAEVLAHIESQTVLVACIGDRIVGSARGIVTGSVCMIRAVSVHPEHQGKRLGSELLRAVESALPQGTPFELLTNTAVPGNVRFYERHGYAVTELRRMSETIELAYMTKAGAGGGE